MCRHEDIGGWCQICGTLFGGKRVDGRFIRTEQVPELLSLVRKLSMDYRDDDRVTSLLRRYGILEIAEIKDA